MSAAILPVINGTSLKPAKPSRDEILKYKSSMQGLYVNSSFMKRLPFWETIAWFDLYSDRQASYKIKRQNKDTHCILDISGAYRSPGQIYAELRLGKDWTNNLSGFRRLCLEALNAGFYLDIRLAGDGVSINNNPSYGEYNDPNGDTYGYEWLMNNFERIFDALSDLNDYIIWVPGYDGVYYGWDDKRLSSDNRVFYFGHEARRIGAKYIGIEFNTGHIPVGGAQADYTSTGKMMDYDIIFGEFDPYNYHSDSTWQILARLCENYKRPFDQPSNDDLNPPYYLINPSNRGKFVFSSFETQTYRWVRNAVSTEEYEDCKNYFLSMNAENLCM